MKKRPRQGHLQVVPKLPGNAADWRKVEGIELWIAMARKGEPFALERLVEAYDEVICPSNDTARVQEAALSIEQKGAQVHEEPAQARVCAMHVHTSLEAIDRRFAKLDIKTLAGLLKLYDPEKKQHGVDGILAHIIHTTEALGLDKDKHGERRDREEIRRYVASVMARKR